MRRLLERRWGEWPLALRLPLLAGAATFLAAILTTQVAVRAMDREREWEAERLGQVYLDGLAAAVLPGLRAGAPDAVAAALERALGFQSGVRERCLVVVAPDGTLLAAAGQGGDCADPLPVAAGWEGPAWRRTAAGDAAWVQRPLFDAGLPRAILAAKLDFTEAAARRRELEFALLVLDLALASIAALLAAFAARRVLAPFLGVARALDRVRAGRLEPIPPEERPPAGTEAGRLAEAYDLMVARLVERRRLAARLSEQDQAALLGRLAATVAHEVRNPLAGMLTAVETARRYGEDRAARQEALDLVERGLRQIQAVVQATLESHRPAAPPRPLTGQDLEDLRLLVAPEARRQGVALEWSAALDGAFPADAVPVRQALLNLLLNAVEASPPGGRVCFAAAIEPGGDLVVSIADEAGGLPEPEAARLAGAEGGGAGLGLSVVMAQLARLDGRIEVDSRPGEGTHIVLRLPPRGMGEEGK
jgi:two-component system OmpR family sensor kinase